MDTGPTCLRLLMPLPAERSAGGHRYGEQLIAALQAAGHDAALIPLAGRFPLPDHAARNAATQAWAQVPTGAVAVVDALGLAAFDALSVGHPAPGLGLGHQQGIVHGRTIGLFHHATPLHNDLHETERATLAVARARAMTGLAGIITSNAPTADRLRQDDAVPADRIRVVPPGLPEWPRAAGSNGPGCSIVSVGALVPRKGHDRLLHALARLFDLDWRLTIIGTMDRQPAYAAELTALAETLGIAARVSFAGDPDDAVREAVWQRADLFASATSWEASGMAAAEALRRGIPVAVTAGGAAALHVTPACGVVAEVADIEGLSKAMRRLIFSRTLRLEFAEQAWRIGQALPGWPDQARAFADAVRELLPA